jgi:hypothetical protein
MPVLSQRGDTSQLGNFQGHAAKTPSGRDKIESSNDSATVLYHKEIVQSHGRMMVYPLPHLNVHTAFLSKHIAHQVEMLLYVFACSKITQPEVRIHRCQPLQAKVDS